MLTDAARQKYPTLALNRIGLWRSDPVKIAASGVIVVAIGAILYAMASAHNASTHMWVFVSVVGVGIAVVALTAVPGLVITTNNRRIQATCCSLAVIIVLAMLLGVNEMFTLIEVFAHARP